MNKIITILILLVRTLVKGQDFIQQTPSGDAKPNYHYFVLYRTWTQGMKQVGDAIGIEYFWKEDHIGFDSIDQIQKWLNIKRGDWYGEGTNLPERYTTAIDSSQLIGVYDLRSAKKINIEFYEEKKSTPKKVVIEADEWINHRAKIKP